MPTTVPWGSFPTTRTNARNNPQSARHPQFPVVPGA